MRGADSWNFPGARAEQARLANRSGAGMYPSLHLLNIREIGFSKIFIVGVRFRTFPHPYISRGSFFVRSAGANTGKQIAPDPRVRTEPRRWPVEAYEGAKETGEPMRPR